MGMIETDFHLHLRAILDSGDADSLFYSNSLSKNLILQRTVLAKLCALKIGPDSIVRSHKDSLTVSLASFVPLKADNCTAAIVGEGDVQMDVIVGQSKENLVKDQYKIDTVL